MRCGASSCAGRPPRADHEAGPAHAARAMTRIYKRRREDALPTPRTALRTRYVRVLVFCNSCRHQADADLRALVLRGQGDVPLTELRFRCSNAAPPGPTSW